MPKIVVSRFVPKYACLYKIIRKTHLDAYTLQKLKALVAHLTFHVSKLKPIHEDKKRKDHKHAYHPRFDYIEHMFVGEVKCILATR
jgi:hypothetical protein